MLRDLVSALDYAVCAESALALFCGTFLLIVYGAMRLSSSAAQQFARIPLTDRIEDPRDE